MNHKQNDILLPLIAYKVRKIRGVLYHFTGLVVCKGGEDYGINNETAEICRCVCGGS